MVGPGGTSEVGVLVGVVIAVPVINPDMLVDVDWIWYSWSLDPAPQNVVGSPGQRKLQSAWLVAFTLPARSTLPQ